MRRLNIPGERVGATVAVDGGRHYTAGISGAFAAGVKSAQTHMAEALGVAGHTHRRRRACLTPYQHCLVGKKTRLLAPELGESLPQAPRYLLGQQPVDTRRMYAGGIRCRRQSADRRPATKSAIRWAGAFCEPPASSKNTFSIRCW